MFERGAKMPVARVPALDPGKDPRIIPPEQFGTEPLQNLELRPGLGETSHRTQAAATETLDREGGRRPDAGFALRKPLCEARRDADLDTGGPGHGRFASGADQ